jgi:BarA-like signal transduction histidine kinase
MKSLHNLRQLCSSLHLRQEGLTRYIGWWLIIGALLATAGVTILLLHAERRHATEHLQAHEAMLTHLLALTAHLGMQALQPRLASSWSVEHVALVALIIFLLMPASCDETIATRLQDFDNVQILAKPFSPTKILCLTGTQQCQHCQAQSSAMRKGNDGF